MNKLNINEDKTKLVRPTIRLDKEFNKNLKVAMIKNDTNFQKLSEQLLEEWYEKHK